MLAIASAGGDALATKYRKKFVLGFAQAATQQYDYRLLKNVRIGRQGPKL